MQDITITTTHEYEEIYGKPLVEDKNDEVVEQEMSDHEAWESNQEQSYFDDFVGGARGEF